MASATPSKILVVEDEVDVRDLISLHLRRDGYEVKVAEDGELALEILKSERFDLIVLDWMLPGLSGIELCKKFVGQFPILMVTARADHNDILMGLEAGADDYVAKPFELSIFMARVRALLRRAKYRETLAHVDKLEAGPLRLDLRAYRALCCGKNIQLTKSEFKALAELVKNRDTILSRRKLIDLIQGEDIVVTDRAIDTLIFGLRKNLGSCSDLVETVRGIGYRFKADFNEISAVT